MLTRLWTRLKEWYRGSGRDDEWVEYTKSENGRVICHFKGWLSNMPEDMRREFDELIEDMEGIAEELKTDL